MVSMLLRIPLLIGLGEKTEREIYLGKYLSGNGPDVLAMMLPTIIYTICAFLIFAYNKREKEKIKTSNRVVNRARAPRT